MKAGMWALFAVALVAVLIVAVPTYGAEKPAKVTLPAAAADAVKKAMPDAKMGKVAIEEEGGMKLYEVKFTDKDKKGEVIVAEDGTIVAVETTTVKASLPEAVQKAVTDATPKGGRLIRAEVIEAKYEVKDAKLVKLDAPKTTYGAIISKDEKTEIEMELAADGKVIKSEEKAKPARKAKDKVKEDKPAAKEGS